LIFSVFFSLQYFLLLKKDESLFSYGCCDVHEGVPDS